MNSLAEELEYLESLEKTEIREDVIKSFEEYLALIESQGNYEGLKKSLKFFLAYSVVVIMFFSQMNAGPKFSFDIAKILSMLPWILQSLIQGVVFSAGGWAFTQHFMSPLEKKMFNILWVRHVSIITFFTGITFWVFGDVGWFGLFAWISGSYLGAHLVSKN